MTEKTEAQGLRVMLQKKLGQMEESFGEFGF
jgi:hypothetical protein